MYVSLESVGEIFTYMVAGGLVRPVAVSRSASLLDRKTIREFEKKREGK